MGGCGRLGRHNFLKVFGVAAHRSAHPGLTRSQSEFSHCVHLLLSNHTQLHNCSTTLLRLTSNRLVRAPWRYYMPQHVWQSLTANFFFLGISFLDRTSCHNVVSQSLSGEVYSKIGCPLFSWSRRKLRPPLPVMLMLCIVGCRFCFSWNEAHGPFLFVAAAVCSASKDRRL